MSTNEMDLCLLSSDISFNVLSRLPANVLVSLKLVSKGWRHCIADPDLMHLQTKVGEPIQISGYFIQEKYQSCDIDVERLSYIPIRSKETKIYQNVLDFLPEKVTILGSSNGLICCRSCIPSIYPSIYICNPVNKQWMNIKWDRTLESDYIAFTFDPAGYKLVRVFEVKKGFYFYFEFEVFNWDTKVWVKSREICHCEDSLCKNRHVYVKGILYWLTDGDSVVMFDTQNDLSLLILLPGSVVNSSQVCIGEYNGQLCCLVVSHEALIVWALEDCFTSNWEPKSFICFQLMEENNREYVRNLAVRFSSQAANNPPTLWMQPLAIKDGLLFLRVSNSAYSFEIHTLKMRFMCDVLDLGHRFLLGPTVIPYSLSFASVAS